MLGASFSNQTTLAAIFAQIFNDFARIFDKSKLLVVRLHPRLLYHLMHCNMNVFFSVV